ncbi:MAG: HAD hydrolase-like protein [Verrucomicrobiota bacterium]
MDSKLLLFDIDGTLVDTRGVGIGCLEAGMRAAFPTETEGRDFPEVELGGATDLGIASPLLSYYQIDDSTENAQKFFDCYLESLRHALRNPEQGCRLPGVKEWLDVLKAGPHRLGLLTGNIEGGAFAKVDAYGLGGIFEIGAYGSDHADRNLLGPVAIDRANEHFGTHFTADQVIVLGDTLKDIACARACGARVAAVATGACSYDVLQSAEPDFLYKSFEDWQQVHRDMGLG